MIDIVDYSTLASLEEAIFAKRSKPPENGYEIWSKYHDALCAVAGRFGKIDASGGDDDAAFYHGGDWFHHHGDGFALRCGSVVRNEVFEELQKVAASHHPDATLSLGGELATPLFGLKVFITAPVILVAWYDKPARVCRSCLGKLGIVLK
jgi:hypothetical protein